MFCHNIRLDSFCALGVLTLLLISVFNSAAGAGEYPVLFTKQKDNIDNLYLATSSGEVQQITDSPRKDSSPMVSPDGRYVVFTSERVGWWKIWKLDLKDRSITQLTDANSAEYAPCWSPLGDRIAFVSSRDGDAEIYIMNSDGSNIRNISDNNGNDSHPYWHSNNRIYYSFEIEGTSQIVSDNPEGSDLQIHTTGDGDKLMPQLSPSGDTLLFHSDMDGNFEIYSTPIGGGEITRLTNNALLDIRARWSPDGQQIVFERGDKRRNQHIFTMNRDGSRQKRLTLHDYNYAPTFVQNCEYLCFGEFEPGRDTHGSNARSPIK
jgi:TolB protein